MPTALVAVASAIDGVFLLPFVVMTGTDGSVGSAYACLRCRRLSLLPSTAIYPLRSLRCSFSLTVPLYPPTLNPVPTIFVRNGLFYCCEPFVTRSFSLLFLFLFLCLESATATYIPPHIHAKLVICHLFGGHRQTGLELN